MWPEVCCNEFTAACEVIDDLRKSRGLHSVSPRPADVAQSRHAFVVGTVSTWARLMTDTRTRKQRQKRHQKCRSSAHCSWEHADRIVGSPSCQSSINYNRSMPEDLELSQIGSSQLPPPLRGLHSPGERKHCQIIFACYFRKSSILAENLKQE